MPVIEILVHFHQKIWGLVVSHGCTQCSANLGMSITEQD